MCNDFGNNIPYSDHLAAFNQTGIPVKWPNAAPNLEPRDDIWPTDRAPVIRRLKDGTNEFSELRWGSPPQMVVLERSDWSAWLEQTENETDLLRALLAGSLKV